jgi:hypothetical protein
MKVTAFALALMLSGAAVAQTTTDPDLNTEANVSAQTGTVDHSTHVSSQTGTASTWSANTMSQVVQPSNASPERDARGIAVISDAATVPAGWNGLAGTAMGGPLVDPATGKTMSSADSYPACSATVTDNCLQTYERGRAK